MRASVSKASLNTESTAKSDSSSSVATPSSSMLTVDIEAASAKSVPLGLETGGLSAMPMAKAVNAANAALMERTPFAIDDTKEDDEDEDEDEDPFGDENDEVMDEVRLFDSLFDSLLKWID